MKRSELEPRLGRLVEPRKHDGLMAFIILGLFIAFGAFVLVRNFESPTGFTSYKQEHYYLLDQQYTQNITLDIPINDSVTSIKLSGYFAGDLGEVYLLDSERRIHVAHFENVNTSFESVCLDSCTLLNTTRGMRLSIELVNGSINITRITYKTVEANQKPFWNSNVTNFTLDKNLTINLTQYFKDPENEKLSFLSSSAENLSTTITDELVRIEALGNFTGERLVTFYATDSVGTTAQDEKIIVIKKSTEEVNRTIGVPEELIIPGVINETVVNQTILLNNTNINLSNLSINVTLNINQTNATQNITTQNISIETIQYPAVVGVPVRWMKRFVATDNITIIDIPENASNIQVNTVDKVKKGKIAAKTQNNKKEKNKLFIYGKADQYEIQYETEAPKLEEQDINTHKKFIKVSSNTNYNNILTYTSIPKAKQTSIRLYWYVEPKDYKKYFGKDRNDTIKLDVTASSLVNLTYEDLDSDGLIEQIQWLTPHLSNQTFEVSITILNVHSHPSLRGNWTVMFNTTGEANLTITATMDANYTSYATRWSNFSEDQTKYDLKYLKLRCGAQDVETSFVGNNCDSTECSVFAENYECNQTSEEISKVLVSRNHVLKFQFGPDEAYAYNAGGTLNATIRYPQNNTAVSRYSVFTVNASITCLSGSCYLAYAVVRYNKSSSSPNTYINTSKKTPQPFKIKSYKGGDTSMVIGWNITDPLHSGQDYENVIDSQDNIIEYQRQGPPTLKYGMYKYNNNGTQMCSGYQYMLSNNGSGVAVDSLDNIYSLGWYIDKYNKTCGSLWQKNFSAGFMGTDVAVDSSNNIILVGRNRRNFKFQTEKRNSAGNLLWTRNFSIGSIAYYVAVDSQDNIIAVGNSTSKDFVVIKYNSTGNRTWNRTYAAGTVAYGVAVDSQNNIIVTGQDDNLNYRTVKYDSTGTLQWNRTYAAGNTSYGVAVDSMDNIIITGLDDTSKLRTIKYNSSGSILWNNTFVGGKRGTGVSVDSQDNIIVTGDTTNGHRLNVRYDVGRNPRRCPAISSGQTCNLTWVVNATGPTNSKYFLDIYSYSNNTGVSANKSQSRRVCIGTCPSAASGSVNVTLISPANMSTNANSLMFKCNISSTLYLKNVSLFHNSSGTWKLNSSINLAALEINAYKANFSVNVSAGTLKWNCRAYDNGSTVGWQSKNWTYKPIARIADCTGTDPLVGMNWSISDTTSCTGKTIGLSSGTRIIVNGNLTITSGVVKSDNMIINTGATMNVLNSKGTIWINANLTIKGTYNLISSTLRLNGSKTGASGINVTSTGKMTVNQSSNITNGVNASAHYYFIVYKGGNLTMRNSSVSQAGWADNKNQRGLEVNGTLFIFDKNRFTRNYFGLTIYSKGGKVRNFSSTNSQAGIALYGAANISIDNCSLRHNLLGVLVYGAVENNITKTIIRNNTKAGIYLLHTGTVYSKNNRISNNFLNNSINLNSSSASNSNVLNRSKVAGKNIIGGPYLGGNYWSDPKTGNYSDTCFDNNGDGICDTKYNATTLGPNVDYLPLLNLRNQINCTTCTSCNNAIAQVNTTGTVRLTKNITNFGGAIADNGLTETCISFNGKDRITFDCRNAKINGDGDNWGYGIWFNTSNSGSEKLVVQNCTNVSSFYEGIEIQKSNSSTFRNIKLYSDASEGILALGSVNNTFYRIVAVGPNMLQGMELWGGGNINYGNYIKNCTFGVPGQQYGLYLYDVSRNKIVNVTIKGATLYGIYVKNSSLNNFSNIYSSGNAQSGIAIEAKDSGDQIQNNIIRNSRIYNNTLYGIYIKKGTAAYAKGNIIYNNFINNTVNLYSDNARNRNYLNSTKNCGQTNIIGGRCIGGNYWTDPKTGNFSDTCSDSNGDGICDKNYTIQINNTDWLPLKPQLADGSTCTNGSACLSGICIEGKCRSACSITYNGYRCSNDTNKYNSAQGGMCGSNYTGSWFCRTGEFARAKGINYTDCFSVNNSAPSQAFSCDNSIDPSSLPAFVSAGMCVYNATVASSTSTVNCAFQEACFNGTRYMGDCMYCKKTGNNCTNSLGTTGTYTPTGLCVESGANDACYTGTGMCANQSAGGTLWSSCASPTGCGNTSNTNGPCMTTAGTKFVAKGMCTADSGGSCTASGTTVCNASNKLYATLSSCTEGNWCEEGGGISFVSNGVIFSNEGTNLCCNNTEDYNDSASGGNCCYNGRINASGTGNGAIQCYNGALYDCGGTVTTWPDKNIDVGYNCPSVGGKCCVGGAWTTNCGSCICDQGSNTTECNITVSHTINNGTKFWMKKLNILNGGELAAGRNQTFFINTTVMRIYSGGKISANVRITAKNLTIVNGGLINASAKGYAGGMCGASYDGCGPGNGTGTSNTYWFGGGGAGYGGRGGPQYGPGTTIYSGKYYGSAKRPNQFGSGGGSSAGSFGGSGGGALFINITNAFNLSGKIMVNGGNGIDQVAGAGGGGSGGSLWIQTQNLLGTGNITVDGGNGGTDAGTYDGGGGAGGRIAIYFNNGKFKGYFSARGGGGSSPSRHGTFYAKGGGSLIFGNVKHYFNNITAEVTNLTIAPGSILNLTGQGYGCNSSLTCNGFGPGAGQGWGGAGAGYGGSGGAGYYGGSGSTYGSLTIPLSIGSSAGDRTWDMRGGAGGGFLSANATILNNSGVISVDGANGAGDATYGTPGGSAGSIYAVTKTLKGNGNFSAKGGAGYSGVTYSGGGGGGGRVSINYINSSFAGKKLTVGGTGYASGKNGTIFECNTRTGISCPGYSSTIRLNTSFTIPNTNTIRRIILNLSQSYVRWNDSSTNNSCVGTYNLTGLAASTKYNIYNNSLKFTNRTTDANGFLGTFSVRLSSNHEIRLQMLGDNGSACTAGTDCKYNLCVLGICRGKCNNTYDGHSCSNDGNAYNSASGGVCAVNMTSQWMCDKLEVAQGSHNYSDCYYMYSGVPTTQAPCTNDVNPSQNPPITPIGMCIINASTPVNTATVNCGGTEVCWNGTSYHGDCTYCLKTGNGCDAATTGTYSPDGLCTEAGANDACTTSGGICRNKTTNGYLFSSCIRNNCSKIAPKNSSCMTTAGSTFSPNGLCVSDSGGTCSSAAGICANTQGGGADNKLWSSCASPSACGNTTSDADPCMTSSGSVFNPDGVCISNSGGSCYSGLICADNAGASPKNKLYSGCSSCGHTTSDNDECDTIVTNGQFVPNGMCVSGDVCTPTTVCSDSGTTGTLYQGCASPTSCGNTSNNNDACESTGGTSYAANGFCTADTGGKCTTIRNDVCNATTGASKNKLLDALSSCAEGDKCDKNITTSFSPDGVVFTNEGTNLCCNTTQYYNNTVAGTTCCALGTIMANGGTSNSLQCYSGALYDCGSQVTTSPDKDINAANCQQVGTKYCQTSTNTWVSSIPTGCACTLGTQCASGLCVLGYCRAACSDTYDGDSCSNDGNTYNSAAAGVCAVNASSQWMCDKLEVATKTHNYSDCYYAFSGAPSTAAPCVNDVNPSQTPPITTNGICIINVSTAVSVSTVNCGGVEVCYNGTAYRGDCTYCLKTGNGCDAATTGTYTADGLCTEIGANDACTTTGGICRNATTNGYLFADCSSTSCGKTTTNNDSCMSGSGSTFIPNGICVSGNLCDTDETCADTAGAATLTIYNGCTNIWCSHLAGGADDCDSSSSNGLYSPDGLCLASKTCGTGGGICSNESGGAGSLFSSCASPTACGNTSNNNDPCMTSAGTSWSSNGFCTADSGGSCTGAGADVCNGTTGVAKNKLYDALASCATGDKCDASTTSTFTPDGIVVSGSSCDTGTACYNPTTYYSTMASCSEGNTCDSDVDQNGYSADGVVFHNDAPTNGNLCCSTGQYYNDSHSGGACCFNGALVLDTITSATLLCSNGVIFDCNNGVGSTTPDKHTDVTSNSCTKYGIKFCTAGSWSASPAGACLPIITYVSKTPANGTRQIKNWIYVNVTVTGSNNIDQCWLQWNNQTNNKNFSMTRMTSGTSVYCQLNKSTTDGYNYIYWVFANDSQSIKSNSTRRVNKENTKPSITSVDVTPHSPSGGSDLTCTASGYNDAESDTAQYYYIWYNNSVVTRRVLKGTNTDIVTAGNTTPGQVWNCSVKPYDGYENGTIQSHKETITNTLPTVTLTWPNDGNDSTYNRTPALRWHGVDSDGDKINYTLRIWCKFQNCLPYPNFIEVNVTTQNYTLVKQLAVDKAYNWTVRARDPTGWGAWATNWTFTIASRIVLTMTRNATNFGTLFRLNQRNTTVVGDSYYPFVVRNDGNIYTDVKLRGLKNLWATVSLNRTNFQFMVGNATAVITYNMTIGGNGSQRTWANVSSFDKKVIDNLNFTSKKNNATIEFKIIVPFAETPGVKNAGVQIIGKAS